MTNNEWFEPEGYVKPDAPEPVGAHGVAEDPEEHIGEPVADPWADEGDDRA